MENKRHWIEDLIFDLKEFRGVKAQPFRWGESCEKSHWRRPATEQWVQISPLHKNGNQIKMMVSINSSPKMEIRKN